MHNIYGFNDPQDRRNEQINYFDNYVILKQRAEQLKVPFSGGVFQDKLPRQETFYDMLRYQFCPRVKCFSLTTFLFMINIIFFIISCSEGIEKTTLLKISAQNLEKLGGNNPLLVHQGQIYRLIASCVLHADFVHLLSNSISLLIFCSWMEHSIGTFSTFFIYTFSGIMANIYTDCLSESKVIIFVGASACIFGLIGATISYLILNWDGMKVLEDYRCEHSCVLCLWVFFIIIFQMIPVESNKNVDINGHFGGFLAGFFMGLCIPKPLQQGTYETSCRILGSILIILFFTLEIAIFFTTKKF